MDTHKTTLFLLLAIFSASSALHKLVPNGKELIYDYTAEVKSETLNPAPFSSNFLLKGKLHVQSDSNSTLLRLSDLKYQLYNGKLHNYERDSVQIPLAEELADLQKPFKVIYNDNGTAIGLVTSRPEKEYVRNMKRAIASILQLDVVNIRLDTTKPHAFITKEESIYGNDKVYYNVLRRNDMLVVQKMHELENNREWYDRFDVSNVLPDYCDACDEDYISRDSERTYEILKKDGEHVIRRIEANGGVYMHPFMARSEAFFIYVNQSMNLVNVEPARAVQQIEDQIYEDNLSYFAINLDDKAGPLPDLTNGRRHIDMEKMMPVIKQMMQEMIEYLKTDHIHMQEPNLKNAQIVNRIVRSMLVLDLATLEKLHNSFNEGQEELVFQQLLPLIGTRASMMMIRNLVQQKKIKDNVAVEMLQTMPRNAKNPTMELLTEMEMLLNFGEEINWQVRKAALLAFGTLMHKTRLQVLNNEQTGKIRMQMPLSEERHEELMRSIDQKLERYVLEIVNRLKSANTYEQQMLYIETLFNTKLESVIEHLEPAVRGEWRGNNHLRALAMWAIYPMAAENQDRVFEIFWPILNDNTLHTELRIIAYYIMMESYPTIERMISISWLLHAERNHELYQFHYRYLTAMSRTTDPCRQDYRVRINQVLRYTYVPDLYGMTGYYQMDYIDPEYKFGGILDAMVIKTDTTMVLKAAARYVAMNIPVNEITILAKIHRVEGLNKLKLETSGNKILSVNELWKIILDLPNVHNIHIELILLRHDQVFNTLFYDGTNSDDLRAMFALLQDQQVKTVSRNLKISYHVNSLVFMPSDIGFPVYVEFKFPTVALNELTMIRDIADKVFNLKIDANCKFSSNARMGINVYNPVADVIQGVSKFRTYDTHMPLMLDISLNGPQQTLKITWQRRPSDKENVIGYRIHSTSMVYIKDDLHHNVLKQSSPKSESFVIVTRGKDFRQEKTLMDKELHNLGYRYRALVYDSERHISNGSLFNLMTKITSSQHKNYQTPIGRLLMTYWNMAVYLALQPSTGSNGLLVTMAPSTEHPVTSNELTIRLNHDVKHEEFVHMPAMKWIGRITYAIKRDDKALKTWDVNAILDIPSGHNSYNLKAQLMRVMPGQKDFKMCLDGHKKWTNEGVNGLWTLAMNQNGDAKCEEKDKIAEMKVVGEKSEEQQRYYQTYDDCMDPSGATHLLHQYVPCYHAHNTLRKYTYTLKSDGLPKEFMKTFYRMAGALHNRFGTTPVNIEENTETMTDNDLKIEVTYPTHGKMIDISMLAPNMMKIMTYAPSELRWIGLRPDTTQFSRMYMFLRTMGIMNHCLVSHNSIRIRNNEIDYKIPNDWTLLVGNSAENPENGLFVKLEKDDLLALRMVHKSHKLEILPRENGYEMTLDGEKLADNVNNHSEDWFHYNRIRDTKFMVLIGHHLGIHVYSNGRHTHVEFPRMDMALFGQCLKNELQN